MASATGPATGMLIIGAFNGVTTLTVKPTIQSRVAGGSWADVPNAVLTDENGVVQGTAGVVTLTAGDTVIMFQGDREYEKIRVRNITTVNAGDVPIAAVVMAQHNRPGVESPKQTPYPPA